MTKIESIGALLQDAAGATPEAHAILSLDRKPLTYGELFDQCRRTSAALASLGIGSNDRVAIVLPNGPEMATGFLGVASGAASAPLNPAYRAAEFDFFLDDLKAAAVIALSGEPSPVRETAARLGIPVIDLHPDAAISGAFRLSHEGEFLTEDKDASFASPSDEALVLHTSGTTSRPKMVPLSQANLSVSAANIRATLALDATDRCLNVMPLFHIHGLMACLTASLRAGASVVCSPGFSAPDFLDSLASTGATWYSAVPTMHQAILSRFGAAPRNGVPRLRFIRSSSASLPPSIMQALEDAFGAPVIEAYGMTEAAHQMASNPLPPAPRKPGSVGLPAGPAISIMEETGSFLPAGVVGEIVIRGNNVTSGYAQNPAANAEAYRAGWFRTGDEGYLDDDGYLYVTGRIKEIINRGGEKISPREVDEVLLSHEAVRQAVTFSVPDEALGEEVGGAVVLKENRRVDERELQEYAAERLVDFKVPRRIVFVDEIPKGPTGKLKRIGLSDALGLGPVSVAKSNNERSDELTPTETLLLHIWKGILKLADFGIDDDFLSLGGDSMLAGRVIAAVENELGARLSFLDFFGSPTIRRLSNVIDGREKVAKEVSGEAPTDLGLRVPATPGQERMLFLDQFDPDHRAYNRPLHVTITGDPEPERIRAAVERVVNRHDALRSRLVFEDDRLVLDVAERCDLNLPIVDLEDDDVSNRLRALVDRPFFVAEGPLVRGEILRTGRSQCHLILVMHHGVFDGGSESIFLEELAVELKDPRAGEALPDAPSFAAHAARQERLKESPEWHAQLDYWEARLRDVPALDVPSDRPRPRLLSHAGSEIRTSVQEPDYQELKALARREKLTPFMILLAAFVAVLARRTGKEVFAVGVPTSGRQHPDSRRMIGLLMNTLVLRLDVSGEPSLLEMARRVRDEAMEGLDRQDVPFELVAIRLGSGGRHGTAPPFRILFNLEQESPVVYDAGNLRIDRQHVPSSSTGTDLSLELFDRKEDFFCAWHFNTELFDAATIARLAGEFNAVLSDAVQNPNEVLFARQRTSLELRAEGDVARFSRDVDASPDLSHIEAKVLEIWRDILQIDVIEKDDDFFDLGGNSLNLLKVQNRILTTLERDVPVRAMFEHKSVAGLAAFIGRMSPRRAEDVSPTGTEDVGPPGPRT